MLMTGEYQLTGVREMASSFLLEADQRFRFYFSYGALDRHASGQWTLQGDDLVFDCDEDPGPAFTLVETHKVDFPGTVIRLTNGDPLLAAYTYVSTEGGKEGSWTAIGQRGECHLPVIAPENISLLFEFCPDRMTTLPLVPGSNYFGIRVEPAIAALAFKGFRLRVQDGRLTGGHPVLQEGSFTYARL